MSSWPAVALALILATSPALTGCKIGSSTSSSSTTTPGLQSQGPAAPALARVNPLTESGNSLQAIFSVTGLPATSGSTLKLYGDGHCGLQVSSGDTYGSTALQFQITFTRAGNATISVKVTDGRTYTDSPCSNSASYTYLGPPEPTGLALSSPATSPNTNPRPTILISGVTSGNQIHLYSDDGCVTEVGSQYASGSSVSIMSTSLAVGSYNFHAKSFDTNDQSTCSHASVAYTVSPPPVPSAVALSYPSTTPNYSQSPRFLVSGVGDSITVRLYSDSACTTLRGTATSSGGTATVYTSSLPIGSYVFYAKSAIGAVNSNCSTANAAYTVASPPVPSALSLSGSTVSPSWSTTASIRVDGVGDDAYIRLYSDSACGGSYLASGYSSAGSANITVYSLPVGTTVVYATAAVGATTAACSTASVSYTVSTPPIPSSLTLSNPTTSPGTVVAPTILVGGVASGIAVKIYTDSGCVTQVASGTAFGTTVTLTTTSLAVGSYVFYAKGFIGSTGSACSTASVAYQLLPPAAPTSLTLVTPSSSPNVAHVAVIQAGGVSSGETVYLYDDPTCRTYPLGSASASGATVNVTTVSMPAGTHQIYATAARSTAISACSTATLQYVVTGVNPGPSPSPGAPPTAAVAYQIDPAHAGAVTFSGNLSFPGSPSWSTTLPSDISYPLIAGGRVFVVVAGSGTGYGTRLYALDLTTGGILWGPVAISGTYYRSGLTYDAGKIFVVNYDGLVRSYDAATGTAGWSAALGLSGISAPPTATNGTLYVGGGGRITAIDERNGSITWYANVSGGDQSSPTISGDGLYLSYPCQIYKFAPVTGALVWHDSLGCSGGGGKTAAFANGSLYVRDSSSYLILGGALGNSIGTFSGSVIPSFNQTGGFFMSSGTVRAADFLGQNVAWSFAGDGHLVSAPIVVNSAVIAGSSTGTVYAIDAATGAQLWSGTAGTSIYGPDEQNVSSPLTGLGAGENYLVVPAGSKLTAWLIGGF